MSRILIKLIGLNLTNRSLICHSYMGAKATGATAASTNNNRTIYNSNSNYNNNNNNNIKNFDNKASPDQLHQLEQKLVEHLPNFFSKPHQFNLYTRDVVFIDNIRCLKVQGIGSYSMQIALIKMFHIVRYSSISLELLNLVKNPEESYLRIRWRIVAKPGFLKFILSFLNFPSSDVWKDGISTLHVNRDGLINCHVCDNIDVETGDAGAKGKLTKTIKNPLVNRGLNV